MRDDFDWRDEHVEQLKTLYADGHSSSEIAARLGHNLSRNAVIGKIHRLCDAGKMALRPGFASSGPRKMQLKRAAPGLAHVPMIARLAHEGANDAVIARQLGLKAEDVRYARRVEGIASTALPQPSAAMAQADEIGKMAGAGRTDREIGDTLGLTPQQVRWVRRQKGIGGNAPKPAQRKKEAAVSDPFAQRKWFTEGYRGQQGRVDLLELMPLMCRFPIDQAEGPVRFCGEPVDEGSSWCAHHAARCCNGIGTIRQPKPAYVYTSRRAT